MAEYIKRELAASCIALETDMSLEQARKILENVPSIDIVHCKDCKYCSIDFIGDYKCDSHRMEVIEEDDYCSYGEKKR